MLYQNYSWDIPLYQKLAAAFASISSPDVILGEMQMPAYIRQGYIEPFPAELENYIATTVL